MSSWEFKLKYELESIGDILSGWAAIKQHMVESQAKQEAFKNGEYGKAKALPLFVKSGEEPAIVSFLISEKEDGEPWANFVHTLPPPPGKKMMVTRKCLGDNCPYCEQGNKPKFRAFFTVIDHRENSFTYKQGEKAGQTVVSKNTKRYYECSAANADMLFQKYGKAAKKQKLSDLTQAVVEISKYGSGTSTTTSYEFEPRADTDYALPEDLTPFNFDEEFSTGSPSSSKTDKTPIYD